MKEKTRRLFKKQVSVPALATPVATVTSGLESWVKDSSDKVRQFFFAYLALITYVLTAVFSTTDKQLLLVNEGLKLPIVDITLPLVGFYVLIPVFILGLHFNLLQNLESHHFKLMELKRAWGGKVPRSHINPLLFDFATLEDGSLLAGWVRAINSLLCLYSGPIAISVVLWRFADYQSSWILLEHVLILWLDLYFVAQTIKAFSANKKISSDKLKMQESVFDLFEAKNNAKKIFKNSDFIRNSLTTEFKKYLKFIANFITAPIQASPRSNWIIVWLISSIIISLKIYTCWSLFINDSKINDSLEIFIPSIDIKENEILFNPDIKKLESYAAFSKEKDWKKHFMENGFSFDFSNRSLKYLSIPSQKLPRLIAVGTQLQNSNMRSTHLQSADFRNAHLQGSNFQFAQLQGINLVFARLQGSSFDEANLRGANLENASLEGSLLLGTKMQGVNLHNARFYGSILYATELEGVDISGAVFDGTYFNAKTWKGSGTNTNQIVFHSELDFTPPNEATKKEWLIEEVNSHSFASFKKNIISNKINYNDNFIINEEESIQLLLFYLCDPETQSVSYIIHRMFFKFGIFGSLATKEAIMLGNNFLVELKKRQGCSVLKDELKNELLNTNEKFSKPRNTGGNGGTNE